MKYQELEQLLMELISTGQIGDSRGRLPGERLLSEQFNVSRSTVRKAIANLQKQGLLVISHGKGTFVKNRTSVLPITSIFQWQKNMNDLRLSPSAKILKQQIIPATKNLAAHLKIREGEEVLMLDKVFYLERIPANETISFFPVALFPEIELVDFSRDSTTSILRSQYSVQPKRTENSIEAVLPSSVIAVNLKITAETPIILFHSVMYGSYQGEYLPMEYFKSYCRTDQLGFGFTLEHELSYLY